MLDLRSAVPTDRHATRSLRVYHIPSRHHQRQWDQHVLKRLAFLEKELAKLPTEHATPFSPLVPWWAQPWESGPPPVTQPNMLPQQAGER